VRWRSSFKESPLGFRKQRCSLNCPATAERAIASGGGALFGDGGSDTQGNIAYCGYMCLLPKEHSFRALGASVVDDEGAKKNPIPRDRENGA
jgi:hypothetical protein